MYSIVLKRNDMGCWPYQQGVADVGHLQAMTKQYPRSPDRQQEAHVTGLFSKEFLHLIMDLSPYQPYNGPYHMLIT